MLKKLLKYDLKWIYKSLVLTYILTILCVIISKIFSIFDTKIYIIYVIYFGFKLLAYCMMGITIFNNLVKLWSRFKNHVYGEESYLIHTLPVTKKDIYLSKILLSIITLTTSIMVILLSVLIITDFKYYSVVVYSFDSNGCSIDIDNLLSQFQKGYLDLLINWGIFLIILIWISLTGFISIIFSQKTNKKKVSESVVLGVSLFIIGIILYVGFLYFIGLFNKDVMKIFRENTIDFEAQKIARLLIVLLYTGINIGYYLLGKKSLEKGIDVD